MIKERHCHRCDKVTRQEVCRRISASLAEHHGWWCLSCNHWTYKRGGGFWISNEQLAEAGVDVTATRIMEIVSGHRCARCGSRGGEEHHWAPRAIFGPDVAESWPKDWLCKSCHDTWHKLVTPQLVK